MNFKVGDKVIIIKANGLNAKVGATAVVTEPRHKYHDSFLITVVWDRNEKSGQQVDGEYWDYYFKPIIKVGQQLEFSFMEEE